MFALFIVVSQAVKVNKTNSGDTHEHTSSLNPTGERTCCSAETFGTGSTRMDLSGSATYAKRVQPCALPAPALQFAQASKGIAQLMRKLINNLLWLLKSYR
jgi:hypothetical protein